MLLKFRVLVVGLTRETPSTIGATKLHGKMIIAGGHNAIDVRRQTKGGDLRFG